ncbi:circularly permuted type 2 ATP-grasp protein [Sediminicoccus sp. KRV36]|uniref:circularly permuted type 2 ATP-grasp protein n=1 Tax=Sediminicoccus sp. KRV36 TaxID=3133721 RepID=UPI00200E4FAF|nr:circularly permuted type 2 ATP-grasp protein [Sediminicoccus rosea]UPY35207.1 circularly permuted type 2 ATP-grasp protein [Sediminicoccus rosea]
MADLLAGGPDEMVSGEGRIRPHWRGIMGVVGSLGRPGLAERGERLARAMADDGVASLLPGASGAALWRLDPLPLPIQIEEFEALAAGVAQRARLLDAVLADLYGAQELLAGGQIPAPLIFGSPAFQRTARRGKGPPRRPLLHLYAVDLVRAPDGSWAVLQDRTGLASGLGQLRENRRLIAAGMPEVARASQPRSISPFFDLWQDSLSRLGPHGMNDPAIALLSPGTRDPHWFEHVVLSRELGCALVETGDLTMRGGALFLKTLGGLQPVDVVLSRVDAAALDPLDQPEAPAGSGVPGMLDAVRHGALTLLNAPGAALGEAPALCAYLAPLAPQMLGEALSLNNLPTHWLPDPSCPVPPLPEGYASWIFRPAGQGASSETMARPAQGGVAAIALPALPVAPSLENGALTPAPFVLRMFAVSDGAGWHVLPGGIARLVTPGAKLTGRLPGGGWCKDVWVPADTSEAIIGPAAQSGPPIAIRRTAGAIPSRVADNLFWLGRYVERLDLAARLMRATITRLRRGAPLPRELAELGTLAICLREAQLLDEEARPSAGSLSALATALERDSRPAVRQLQGTIGSLIESVRDRLTADMHATLTQTLRTAEEALDNAAAELPDLARALLPSLRFANAVAGIASENMVRGGARLFLELGRRMERAHAVASEVAVALDAPAARIEAGLRLTLELCDSVITYRSRYLAVLQPAPALDLVLADASNPRGLAFQLDAIAAALREITEEAEDGTVREVQRLLAQAEGITARLLAASDQAEAATTLLPPQLRAMAAEIATLSDQVSRRYFALLPAARVLGVDVGEAAVIEA